MVFVALCFVIDVTTNCACDKSVDCTIVAHVKLLMYFTHGHGILFTNFYSKFVNIETTKTATIIIIVIMVLVI